MKSDTALDYAEFQLSTSRTRCELFVSAEGVTEKLASGSLKPFVTHLRAAEEQIARGCSTIRLEARQSPREQNDSTWFTKGTLERFVRFVSTPEVLERVKTIEDELMQLEQVRKIQATSLAQTEECLLGVHTAVPTADGKSATGICQERNGTSAMSRRYLSDRADNEAEVSKRELLRAMDMRLLALQQEQNMAFARASAAGFDRDYMSDLMAFSEHFGADRLREACMQFTTLSRKRQGEQTDSPIGEDASSSSDMSLASGSGGDLAGGAEVYADFKPRNSFEARSRVQNGKWDSDSAESCSNGLARTKGHDRSVFEDGDNRMKGRKSSDLQNKWGPQENSKSHQDVEQSVDIHGKINSQCSDVGIKAQSSVRAFYGAKLQDHWKKAELKTNENGSDISREMAVQGRKSFMNGKYDNSNECESASKEGMFYSRLRQMSQKVEARRAGHVMSDSMHSTSSEFALSDQMEIETDMNEPNSSSTWQESAHEMSSPASCLDSADHTHSSPALRLNLADHMHSNPEREDATQVDDHRGLPQRSSSPKWRPASPLQRIQIGPTILRRTSSLVTNDSSSQEQSGKDKSSANGSINNDNEDNLKNGDSRSSGPARRLSVQDAISLFESKQRDSNEAPIKRLGKPESRRGSVESGNSSSAGKAVLRRWSITNDHSSGASSQQETEIKGENQRTENKSQPEAKEAHGENVQSSTSGLIEASSRYRDQPSVDQQGTQGLKGSSDCNSPQILSEDRGHLQPNSSIAPPASSEEFSDRKSFPKQQYTMTTDSHKILEEERLKHFKVELAKQPNSSIVPPASSEAFSDRKSFPKQQYTMTTDSHKMLEEERLKHFKVELAKSLTREAVSSNLTNTSAPSRSETKPAEAGSLLKKKTSEFDSTKLMDGGSEKEILASTSGSASLEIQEKINPSRTPRSNSQLIRDASVLTALHAMTQEPGNARPRNVNQSEIETSVSKGRDAAFRESSKKVIQNSSSVFPSSFSVKVEKPLSRELLGTSWSAPIDFNMQALVTMVDNQNNEPAGFRDEFPQEQRGRHYEQYMKLRDAKLRNEQASKRAEREAKLKAMEETLDKRKAEMDAKKARSSKRNNSLVQAHFRVLKAGISISKGEQEEEEDDLGADQEDTVETQDPIHMYSSPTSPSSTPRAASRPYAANKRTAQKYQKSTSIPMSSTHVSTLSSPTATVKNLIGMSASQQKPTISTQSGIADNPLTKSVPCFTDLRKENTKASPGRPVGSTRPYTKANSYSGRSRTTSEPSPLEVNGNISAQNTSRPAGKEDKKRRSMQTRKSCATVSEFKTLPGQKQEGTVTAPLKVQKEEASEPPMYSKVRRNAVAPIQEVKPFLRKGHGIGPGAGPGVMKLKATTVDASKSSDEEASATPMVEDETNSPEGHDEGDASEIGDLENPCIVDDPEGWPGSEAHAPCSLENSQSSSLPDDQPEKSAIATLDELPNDASDNDRTCAAISFPIDLQTQKGRAFVNNPGSIAEQSFLDISHCKQEDGCFPAPLSQLLSQDATETGKGESSMVTSLSSFRASSLPREHIRPTFSPAAVSPSSSSMVRPGAISDHFSPPSAVSVDSPIGSPASWNSSQIQYGSEADSARSRKKWSASQKLVLVATQPPKEPAKGLKRLLKFGRKNRTSETATNDWVSASTTSEGDDDGDESRDIGSRSSDDLLRPARMQERNFDFTNAIGSGDHYSIQDQGMIQSVRSSIPAPPANFKLRDDHLSGGTLLKAPRSFFSLSSFRSKGGEGKSR